MLKTYSQLTHSDLIVTDEEDKRANKASYNGVTGQQDRANDEDNRAMHADHEGEVCVERREAGNGGKVGVGRIHLALAVLHEWTPPSICACYPKQTPLARTRTIINGNAVAILSRLIIPREFSAIIAMTQWVARH